MRVAGVPWSRRPHPGRRLTLSNGSCPPTTASKESTWHAFEAQSKRSDRGAFSGRSRIKSTGTSCSRIHSHHAFIAAKFSILISLLSFCKQRKLACLLHGVHAYACICRSAGSHSSVILRSTRARSLAQLDRELSVVEIITLSSDDEEDDARAIDDLVQLIKDDIESSPTSTKIKLFIRSFYTNDKYFFTGRSPESGPSRAKKGRFASENGHVKTEKRNVKFTPFVFPEPSPGFYY